MGGKNAERSPAAGANGAPITGVIRDDPEIAAILNAALDGFWLLDTTGRLLEVNDAYCVMSGYTRDELLALSISDLEAIETPHETASRIRADIERGSDRFKTRHRRKDGTLFDVEIGVRYLSSQGGRFAVFLHDITAQTQAETQLRENLAILQAAMDQSSAGIAIADAPDGRLRYVNDAGLAIRGGDRKTIVDGVGIEQYVASWQLADLDGRPLRPDEIPLARAIMFGEPNSRQFVVKRDDGEDRVVIGNAAPIREGDEVVAGIVVFTDVTETERLQRELRASEERLMALFEQAPLGYQSLDEDGRFLEVNQTWLDLLGYSREEVAGKWFGDFLAPEFVEPFRTRFPLFKERGAIHSEFQMVRKDGTRMAIGFEGRIGHNPDGSFKQTHCILEDITERRKAEIALRESEDKFRFLFERSIVAKSITRPTGEINVNRAFCDLLGYEPEELRDSATWQQLTHPDDIPSTDKIVASILAGDAASARFEKRYVRKDGTVIWADVNTSLRRDTQGDPEYFITTILDITERKRYEDRLREGAEMLRRTFAEAPLPMMVHAEDGEVLQINAEWERSTGYSLAEIPTIGDWTEKAYGSRAETVRADIDALYDLTEPRDEGEYVIRTKDGSERIWHFRSAALDTAHDGQRTVISTATDVTERNLLDADLARQKDRVERTLTSVIDIARDIVEERDPYTAGHQLRVSQIATAVATKLGMPDADVEGIRLASLLHDVGKVAVPSEILSKPGAISRMEYELLKTHAEAGHRILAAAHMDEPLPELVYQHHERCDGSGYPRGLTRDQMLPGARVIAVADVVEAMSSHRPYRPALGIDCALEEIEQGAGRLYDEEVARACIALFREDGFEPA